MAGSSTPRKKSSSSRPPRDPSDDQAVPLVKEQSREQEWNKVRNGKSNKQQQQQHRNQQEQRPRSDRRPKNGDKQQQGQHQKSPGRGGQKGDYPKGKSRNSLSRFIGKQNDVLPPIKVDSTSVACSALTTPSVLVRGEGLSLGNDSTVSGGGASILDDDDDDASHEPLLAKKNPNVYSLSSSSASSSINHGKQGKRVGNNTKYQSRNGRSNNNRSSSRNNDHHETSALSMRRPGKKPWFSNNSSSNNNRNNTNGKSYSAATGVQYRSATSTQKALEELKRKRIETQEKRRAMSILVVLIMIAGGVHFAGQNGWSGIFGGTSSSSSAKGEASLRGSRDKVYGDTKDLNYGGEREGFVQSALKLAKGEYKQSSAVSETGEGTATDGTALLVDANGEEEEYEYKLPAPVEKTYDDEHEFLLPLRHFADVSDPNRPGDTAFFFHVPRAGGSTMKEILGKCLKLVQSSDVGVRDGHGNDPVIQVLDVQESKYVNVDTTTIPGIQRAVDLGLSSSGLADVIVSSYFQESAALFDLTHQGRGFIVLRDPIERATSMYWHRIKETGDLDETTTIEDYAQGNGIENNWMVRFLANRMTGELTKEDLEQAKEILKDKLLVGFIDDLDESVYRLMRYNGWSFSKDATDQMREEDCIKDLASSGSNVNQYEYEIPKRGSQAHALISWQTQFDMKLFTYAKEVFEHQTKEWGSKERKKQLKKDKKKAKGG